MDFGIAGLVLGGSGASGKPYDLAAVAGQSETRGAVSIRKSAGQMRHLRWKQPNPAWAIDATEYGRDGQGQRLWVHAVRDSNPLCLFGQ